MNTFHLEIVTPDGIMFDGMAESLLVRTDDGDVEILCGHADFVATVAIGRTRVTVDGTPRYASSAGGFLSVKGGTVRLVATTFEFADNIDLKRAELSKERAEQLISDAKTDRELRVANAKMMRALNRIYVVGLK